MKLFMVAQTPKRAYRDVFRTKVWLVQADNKADALTYAFTEPYGANEKFNRPIVQLAVAGVYLSI